MALIATPPFAFDFADQRAFAQEAFSIAEMLDDKRRLAESLTYLGYTSEPAAGRKYYEASLAICRTLNDPWYTAFVLGHFAGSLSFAGEHTAARQVIHEALELAKQSGDPWLIAREMNRAGWGASFVGNTAEAREFFSSALKLSKELNDPIGTATNLNSLGEVARVEGNYAEAMKFYQEAQRYFLQTFGRPAEFVSSNQTFVALHLEELEQATNYLRQILEGYSPTQDDSPLCFALAGAAAIAIQKNQYARAAELMGFADQKVREQNITYEIADATDYNDTLSAVRTKLNDEKILAAWERGRALTYEEAIRLALNDE